ncbi:hypothetical protein KKJFFJLC_00059 [Vibrio phage vB_VpaS_PGB]|nr:hypothetical protein HHKILHMN_00038 [Vibrio phage vB_VpaS_PGA]WVH05602.1 hypothetical protein KKJFFJLC_00059 [Vibrio phage vB_VpaS_PGB]
MASIDPRLLRLGITIDGKRTWYENYFIHAKGTKVSAALSSECNITITGLKSETQNYILQNCRPGPIGSGKRVRVELEVGRESYGTSPYYSGDVFRAYPTPKPDIGINMKCLIGFANKRKIISRGGLGQFTSLRQIATWVAEDNGYKLSFQIPDRNIRSYSFTGSAQASLEDLEQLANAEVFVDSGTLYIKRQGELAKGKVIYKVSNKYRNLIQAQATEFGVVVKMLFHPDVTIGSVIELESELNPSINGTYSVFRANFDVKKRGTEFYLTVECLRR